MANIKAAIITIGDELLIGQTIDTNSAYIAQQLNALGVDVVRRIAVGDNDADIRAALDAELPGVSVLLITGGLGPTADDITKPLLCSYFGGKLVVNRQVEDYVREIFARRNLPILERNLKQAEVPDNCEVLFNNHGTAPGMLFRRDGKIIISMPGVPGEMKGIMQDHVVGILKDCCTGDAMVHTTIMTSGMGESFIAEKIKDIEEALPPYIKLAYLPHNWTVKLRLTGKGKEQQRLEQEVVGYRNRLAERLEDIVVALQDIPLEEVLGNLLAAQGKTAGFAESCTGGFIAHKITNIPGSSAYFQGSLVCYQDEIKQNTLGISPALIAEHGVVSSEVAAEMAKGAMKALGSNYGLGITGVLGPAMEDDTPVGTVWIGLCDGERVKTRKFNFPYDRAKNKELAADMALLSLWKFVQGKL